MASPMLIPGFADIGETTENPPEITEDILEKLKEAAESHYTGVGTGLEWNQESMSTWSYRIAKWVKYLNDKVNQNSITTQDHVL